MNRRTLLALSTAALPFPRSLAWAAEEPSSLLNVSYDIARELFAQINPLFAASWREAGGGPLEVNMSHGGSSRQARAVIEGLEADVVTLNQVSDVEALVKNGLVAANWQPRLPLHLLPDLPGAPGQPEEDRRLARPRPARGRDRAAQPQDLRQRPLQLPRGHRLRPRAARHRSGGGRAVREEHPGQRRGVRHRRPGRHDHLFVEREIGEVLITFEAKIQGIGRQHGEKGFELVLPGVSVKAEFPVAVVDKVVDARGLRRLATAYLDHLFRPEGQEILARNGYRVIDAAGTQRHAASVPPIRLIEVETVFGDRGTVAREQFGGDGVLDRLMAGRR